MPVLDLDYAHAAYKPSRASNRQQKFDKNDSST
jgi:hypothetical protein